VKNNEEHVIYTFTSGVAGDEANLATAAIASHGIGTVGVLRADPNGEALINICKAE
jgi:hypothetical protein